MRKILQSILGLICPKPQEPSKPKTLLTYKEIVLMLSEYDETRLKILTNELGFEDTRVNTFGFQELKNYLDYVEKIANKKGIQLKGISFIKGVYNKENTDIDKYEGYENLLYTPTAIVDGVEVAIDVLKSKKGKIVTLKEVLEHNGYEWRYDSRKKKETQKHETKTMMMRTEITLEDSESGVGNKTKIAPPHD